MVGVVYTVLSEWANVHMFKSWGYKQSMPIIPWVQMGLTPFLQWILIPPDNHPVGAASSFIRSRNEKRKGGIKMTKWEYI
jgi:hypothetical protein